MSRKALMVVAALMAIATVARADCTPAPPWRQTTSRGHPNAEISACLKEKAYDARNVAVPIQSKAAGIIAQCEVDVDRYEGRAPFGWDEQWVSQQASAAVVANQSCSGR
jgi:hypothetical protein